MDSLAKAMACSGTCVTVLGGDVDVPIPIAFSDWENDEHQINGVYKTPAEMWTLTDWGDGTVSIVDDVGLVYEYMGTSTSATGLADATAALRAAVLDTDVGHSGVMSVSIVGDAVNPYVGLQPTKTTSPFSYAGAYGLGSLPGGQASTRIFPAAYVASATATPLHLDGTPNIISYRITPTEMALSINGSAVVSTPMQSTLAELSEKLYYYMYLGEAAAGAAVTTKRIDFYAPLTDAQLIALAAA